MSEDCIQMQYVRVADRAESKHASAIDSVAFADPKSATVTASEGDGVKGLLLVWKVCLEPYLRDIHDHIAVEY